MSKSSFMQQECKKRRRPLGCEIFIRNILLFFSYFLGLESPQSQSYALACESPQLDFDKPVSI